VTSLFGENDIEDIPSNPFYVAPGTYDCVVDDASINEKNDGSGDRGFSIRYRITEDGDYYNNTVQEWKDIVDAPRDELDSNQKRKQSFLIQRLEQLGVPRSEMNALGEDPTVLVGITGTVTVKETQDKDDPDKTYTNVVSFKVD